MTSEPETDLAGPFMPARAQRLLPEERVGGALPSGASLGGNMRRAGVRTFLAYQTSTLEDFDELLEGAVWAAPEHISDPIGFDKSRIQCCKVYAMLRGGVRYIIIYLEAQRAVAMTMWEMTLDLGAAELAGVGTHEGRYRGGG